MPRTTFDQRLQALQDDLIALSSMVEEALIAAMDALKARDFEASHRIIAADKRINQKRYEIERKTLVLMATQQPMATDLRVLASILEIATELERMGDYAKGIASINLKIGEQPLMKPLIDLPRMAEKARDMLHRAVQAFVRRDLDAAHQIIKEDDEVDALYDQVYRELITYILQDPRNIDQATYLLWAAHNVERTADRVTNICERVIFVVTGELVDLDASEADEDVG